MDFRKMIFEMFIDLTNRCYKHLPTWLKTALAKRLELTLFLSLCCSLTFWCIGFFFVRIPVNVMLGMIFVEKSDSKYDMYVIGNTVVRMAVLLFALVMSLVWFSICFLIYLHMALTNTLNMDDLFEFDLSSGGSFN
nr:uncharacterized protein LOC111515032 [Leptinotarsa decemlineata]